MKNIIIGKIGENQTIDFAIAELRKYLLKIDDSIIVDVFPYDNYDESRNDLLWIGLDNAFENKLPEVKDKKFDDAIVIDVTDYTGIITGTNERSVLIAVYRFLREIGCAFVRPGVLGEIIPEKEIEKCSVKISEIPSYRNRMVCIEGACSYQNVYDMVDWLPKVGLNGYFVQFYVPFDFFDRWYSHAKNENFEPVPFSMDDAKRIHKEINKEISKRSLCAIEVGHGWHCVPFGLDPGGWKKITEEEVPETMRPYLAMKDGKRGLIQGCPLNTQLCYSNEYVRNVMVEAIVKYCKEHPVATHLNICLADTENNHCECEECSKMIPSDWFVMMLNQLDERMTEEGLTQKMVIPVYLDLMYAPQHNRLKNKERFVLEFAPITRKYSESFLEIDLSQTYDIAPYKRNKLNLPSGVRKNLQLLRAWFEVSPDVDTLDFDYHLWTDHFYDLGYFNISQIIHDDIVALEKIGLNGMVSCQMQRCFLQNNLPMVEFAETLWNKNLTFEEIAEKHFYETFGEGYEAAKEFYEKISHLVCTPYAKCWNKLVIDDKEKKTKEIEEAITLIAPFEKVIATALETNKNKAQRKSWEYTQYNTQLIKLYIAATQAYIAEDRETIDAKLAEIIEYLKKNEENIHPVYDVWRAIKAMQYHFEERK